MCIICNDLDVNKLTPWEAARNRAEMLEEIPDDHLEELDNKIKEATVRWLATNGDFPVLPPFKYKAEIGTAYSD
tara:strand:+ start:548 stop:769 length:222 start_codon:yes stop_codon:yes gene_type:complete